MSPNAYFLDNHSMDTYLKCTIRHKSGLDLGNADALSHLPQPEITDKDFLPGDLVHLLNHLSATTTNASSIKRLTDTDPVLN